MIKQTEQQIKNTVFSGVVSIRTKDQVIMEHSSGYKDIANQLFNQTNTLFGLASGAKTFTAIAILKLQEQGKLNVQKPVSTYVSSDVLPVDERITIHHLLTHSSGLLDYLDEDKDLDLSHIPWHKLLKPSDYFPYFPQGDLEFTPGTAFKYNNGAYVLLAHVIDVISGDFHRFVHDMLEEIGIVNTKYYRFDQLPYNTANGYVFSEDGSYKTNIYDLPIIGGGDGGIFSSAEDLFNVWQALNNHTILNKESVEMMFKAHMPVRDNRYYGYGVWITKFDESQQTEMIGQDQGVSFISSYNDKNQTVTTILSNNDRDAWKVLNILEENEE